jgi:hypothetical protein
VLWADLTHLRCLIVLTGETFSRHWRPGGGPVRAPARQRPSRVVHPSTRSSTMVTTKKGSANAASTRKMITLCVSRAAGLHERIRRRSGAHTHVDLFEGSRFEAAGVRHSR